MKIRCKRCGRRMVKRINHPFGIHADNRKYYYCKYCEQLKGGLIS